MKLSEKKVYQVILVLCSIAIGLLSCSVDHTITKCDAKVASMQEHYDIGVEVENYIIDVIYETDLLEDITEEERSYLEELEDTDLPRYCVELIAIYGKYYRK